MAFVEVQKVESKISKTMEGIREELQSLIYSWNYPFRSFCASI